MIFFTKISDRLSKEKLKNSGGLCFMLARLLCRSKFTSYLSETVLYCYSFIVCILKVSNYSDTLGTQARRSKNIN